MPVEDAPFGVLDAVRSLRVVGDVMSRSVADPPAARLDELPALDPEDEPAVPNAVLLEPLPAVALPAPRVEDVPPFAP
jgi:hypothetical protein